MSESTQGIPAKLLADFADYCLYLSPNNVIEQRFSMEHFITGGYTDREFPISQRQLSQLEQLVARHNNSDPLQSEQIKKEIERKFLTERNTTLRRRTHLQSKSDRA
ncbi:hypothetical protein LFYK43_08690 [Ligilactobacillus salitolerans]|uniref:Uncharacterized protein n=1 Tax=Ligilactobacillus salitolerans TaxID=1808352 RepID=A0A401IS96_9LACO|nr:hypothetical protein [Ligilactobacillus salitolerans]GBG94410.1 hypothetical protein LFYK43_08690 [Ligilactobacillus salitolerans]